MRVYGDLFGSEVAIDRSCHISTIAVRVLWVIPTLLAALNLKWTVPLLVQNLKATKGSSLKERVADFRKKGPGKFCVPASIWALSVLITGLSKQIDPVSRLIGPEDPFTFNVFTIGGVFFYWSTIFASKMSLVLALKGMGSKGDPKMAVVERVLKFLAPKGYMDTFFIMVAVILGNVGYKKKNAKIVLAGYLVFNLWRSM